MISTFALAVGAFMLLNLLVAAYLFRTAHAPMWMKFAIPILTLLISWWTPTQVAALMGFPLDTTFASLPQQAELIAFVPHDDDKSVDLWLREDNKKDPRSYSVPLTEELKGTLRRAKEALAGGRVELGKRGQPGKKRPHQQYSDIDGGSAPYELLPNSVNLPPKGTEQ
jgi:hypothetical protein